MLEITEAQYQQLVENYNIRHKSPNQVRSVSHIGYRCETFEDRYITYSFLFIDPREPNLAFVLVDCDPDGFEYYEWIEFKIKA